MNYHKSAYPGQVGKRLLIAGNRKSILDACLSLAFNDRA